MLNDIITIKGKFLNKYLYMALIIAFEARNLKFVKWFPSFENNSQQLL